MLFSEATFETMLPWRPHGASVPSYLELTAGERRDLAERRLPAAVAGATDGFKFVNAVLDRAARELRPQEH